MPRNINVYPFRFFGDIWHAPLSLLPSRFGVAFSCLRHSTVDCLSPVSCLRLWLGNGWGSLCVLWLVSFLLTWQPSLPLWMLPAASCVACLCLLPAPPSTNHLKQRRRRHRPVSVSVALPWLCSDICITVCLPASLPVSLSLRLAVLLSVYQAASSLSQCTVGQRWLKFAWTMCRWKL